MRLLAFLALVYKKIPGIYKQTGLVYAADFETFRRLFPFVALGSTNRKVGRDNRLRYAYLKHIIIHVIVLGSIHMLREVLCRELQPMC